MIDQQDVGDLIWMYLTRTGSSIAGTPAKIRAKVAKLEQINAIVVSARINVLKRWLLLPPRTGVPATLRVAGAGAAESSADR
jgi:hypothetical protein